MRFISETDAKAIRAHLIVESIPGLVAVMTPEGSVEHVNGQVLDYFGRTSEELKKWGTSDAVQARRQKSESRFLSV